MTLDLSAFESLPREAIPSALGELERVRALLWARLATPAQPERTETQVESTEERWLTVEEVAERLRVSPRWVYRHRRDLGGKKVGAKVRFSENGIQRYLRRTS